MTDQASRDLLELVMMLSQCEPHSALSKDTLAKCLQAITHANTEMEKMRKRYEVVRLHAISADCGRMCDNNKSLNYREQWKLSEAHIDGLERIALELPPTPQAEG